MTILAWQFRIIVVEMGYGGAGSKKEMIGGEERGSVKRGHLISSLLFSILYSIRPPQPHPFLSSRLSNGHSLCLFGLVCPLLTFTCVFTIFLLSLFSS